MTSSRHICVILALIILIKSFHCLVVESRFFLADQGLAAVTSSPDDLPKRPINSHGGCESGCLCRGAIFQAGPELPAPEISIETWRDSASIGQQLRWIGNFSPWYPGSSLLDVSSGWQLRIALQSFLL